MLIDLYELPALGGEEDGVDNLATPMALEDYGRDDDPIILDAAYRWGASMRRETIAGMSRSDVFDEPSISTQRAFEMICVPVGRDKAEFGDIRDGSDPESVDVFAIGAAEADAPQTLVAEAGDAAPAPQAKRDGFSIRSSWSTPNTK